ncbi:D-alanyl-D-alanine carboxypeptidase/D-alanyl-D-alanine-endopeptidase (penicillin-binding protein 4) [Actinomadura luteofluorescens]|uniref:D-alanyl-D-alanine carboxypeptidase/D-alanyl-D-alanine-endopeptidase (Penicillin-binding protein 4) n=1 Tax=Actinomadura luteofluorescens TaxID=46163 RepID=A0A7Y9JHK9_9ACTN|nr:D-alanyl-D-alanine carboxypeptidase/D-alanyl-D-alanine-endopeptidase [Actinomadura luteofluorescens]NYD47469.1 D-alanyl-D-alanine carboxypeptidase/D-alanyl-D-alanine-endopeptidase (penicillin-binding protein 4) [Actinomadura luteofluorescens]
MRGPLVRITSVLVAGTSLLAAPAMHPAALATARAGTAAKGDLGKDLDAILADGRLKGATVGAVVRDARTGAVRYSRGATAPVMPASNMKLYTSGAALSLLGPGYRFRTGVYARAVSGTTVKGDLYLKGTGDPTTRAADYDRLAAQVAARGVRRVEGGLVADDTWFDAVRTPSHWDPTDLQYYYAAQTSALTVAPNDDFDAGSVEVSVRPGAAEGAPVAVGLAPATRTVKIDNRAVTGAPGTPSTLAVNRAEGAGTIVVSGSYPAGAAAYTTLRTVENPSLYAADVFRSALRKHGVQVKGATERGRTPKRSAVLAARSSMPLSRLMVPFLKLSNNMVAETLVKAIGREKAGKGSWTAGLPVVEKYARGQGVPIARLKMADGSGLSRENRTTAQDVSTILRKAQGAPWFGTWYRALPVAGDPDRLDGGTLRSRMQNTPAAGNVHAKTGTLTGASALSGYVTDASGRRLVFSVVLNGYQGAAPKDIEDRIAIRLAGGDPAAVRTFRASGNAPQLECSWIGRC